MHAYINSIPVCIALVHGMHGKSSNKEFKRRGGGVLKGININMRVASYEQLDLAKKKLKSILIERSQH